jgi:hypothetical protein
MKQKFICDIFSSYYSTGELTIEDQKVKLNN